MTDIAAGEQPLNHNPGRVGHAIVRLLKKDRLFLFGAIVVSISILLALFGPLIAPYDPESTTAVFSEPPPPILQWPYLLYATLFLGEPTPHWFGTDNSGLDIFSRVISAPRADLTIALTAAAFSATLGTSLGLLAGFKRNWATQTLMRVSDVMQSFPAFITAMILVALAGRSIPNIIITLGIVYTPIFLRLTRAEVSGQMTRGYVEAARAIGNSGWQLAFRHILPNSIVPSLIQLSTTVGFAILLTSGLSFVGAGVRPPYPEWGLMIAQGAPQMLVGEWWQSIFPGFAVSITILGYAVVGHAFEQAYE